MTRETEDESDRHFYDRPSPDEIAKQANRRRLEEAREALEKGHVQQTADDPVEAALIKAAQLHRVTKTALSDCLKGEHECQEAPNRDSS